MKRIKILLVILITALLQILSFQNPIKIFAAGGFGILGDSGSDEYRADNNRGGSYKATTLNWMELLVKYRGVDAGPWGTRSEPRRSGYEYNWARSGAKAADLIQDGQADGLADQVRSGLVKYVYIQIGVNDFSPWTGSYKDIYDGNLTQAQIDSKVNSIVSDITQSVNKLQSAGSPKIVLSAVIDRGPSPNIQKTFPDATKRQKVTNVINTVNTKLKQMAGSTGITYIDTNAFANTLLSKIDSSGNMVINGEKISLAVIVDEPHHFVLGDNEHPGTVGGGLMSNYLIEAFNSTYGWSLAKFSDTELLQNAGIGGSPNPTPTKTPSPTPTKTPTPTPATKAGDVNNDNKVDIVDIGVVIDNYGVSPITNQKADVNRDGKVDIIDIGIIIDNYGK